MTTTIIANPIYGSFQAVGLKDFIVCIINKLAIIQRSKLKYLQIRFEICAISLSLYMRIRRYSYELALIFRQHAERIT